MDYLLAASHRNSSERQDNNFKPKTSYLDPNNVWPHWIDHTEKQRHPSRNNLRKRPHSEQLPDVTVKQEQISENEYQHPNEIEAIESQEVKVEPSENPASVSGEFYGTTSHHPMAKRVKETSSQYDPVWIETPQMNSTVQTAVSTVMSSQPLPADHYQVYANYLASKFRSYTQDTFLAIENKINYILYCADNDILHSDRRQLP